jgi:esterase/lipase superfamily enzyme
METKDFTLHRDGVDGDFDVTLYGTAGRPVIAFPEGDSSCASWEEGGMVDALAGLIDAGRVRLFCVDSADGASWYAGYAPTDYRIASLGGYFDLVENELCQLVRDEAPGAGAPIVAGAGLGALNATIAMLRKPSIYGGLLACGPCARAWRQPAAGRGPVWATAGVRVRYWCRRGGRRDPADAPG